MTEIDNLYRPTIQKVHIIHDDTKQQSPAPKARELVLTVNSYPLSIGANPSQVLGHALKRKYSEIVINGTGIVAFGKTMADCQAAAANASGEQTGNVFVINGNGFASRYCTRTTSALWAVLIGNSPGPSANNPSANGMNSVPNPGAFATIATTNSLPAGTYSVTATVYLSGTVTSADANNMELFGTGIATTKIAYPGVANTPVTLTAIVTTTGAGAIGVQSIGAASGASAVYNASIVATQLTNPAIPTVVSVTQEIES